MARAVYQFAHCVSVFVNFLTARRAEISATMIVAIGNNGAKF
jgi:hypothetical protein